MSSRDSSVTMHTQYGLLQMKKGWDFDKEELDRLLFWLDPNRERAAQKYEEIRSVIIKMMLWRGCSFAEEIADEAINRVISKLPELLVVYEGNPALYFYSVAKNVYLEELKKRATHTPLSDYVAPERTRDEPDDLQDFYDCLDKCLNLLSGENRKLILKYYDKEKQEKIDFRKALAEELNIKLNTLRMRASRIRLNLQDCLNDCLGKKKVE